MSVYKGKLAEKSSGLDGPSQVTVDSKPLPEIHSQMPGVGQGYGWGPSGTWASKKLLAHSILFYELHVIGSLSEDIANRRVIALADFFMSDWIGKLNMQWSISSDEIRQWIEKIQENNPFLSL